MPSDSSADLSLAHAQFEHAGQCSYSVERGGEGSQTRFHSIKAGPRRVLRCWSRLERVQHTHGPERLRIELNPPEFDDYYRYIRANLDCSDIYRLHEFALHRPSKEV